MKKKRIIVTSLVIGAILIIAGAGTYAYWQLTKTQQDTNDVIAACLDFDLTNADNANTGITLNNAWPMSDEDGLASSDNEYSFVVTNHCEEDVNYEIALERYTNENSLSSSSIVIGLDNKKVGILNNLQDREKEDNTATDSKLIGSATVAGNDSNTHDLKLWIDANAPVTEQGKTFSGKVYITGGQGIETPTSSLQILSGDLDTVGSEVAIGTEHFYVIESDENEVQLLSKYNLLLGINYYPENLLSEEECNEIGGVWNEYCYGIKIPSTVEGYNKQSSEAIGGAGENYKLVNSNDDSIYATWSKDELPNKNGNLIDFNALDFNYYLDFKDRIDEWSATVKFSNNILVMEQNDIRWFGYWWDDQNNDFKEEYYLKEGQILPYVYDKNNEYNTISEYVENYKYILENEYEIEIEEAKLLSFEKAIELLECEIIYDEEYENEIKEALCVGKNIWAWNTVYWLGSATDKDNVIIVDGTVLYAYAETNDDMAGVRPVIVLDKSKI